MIETNNKRYIQMDSNSPVNINVFSWNLLSTDLTDPKYHCYTKPEYLSIQHRFPLVWKTLETQIEQDSILCFQELSKDWISLLTPKLRSRGYTFLYNSEYLGAGIAIPQLYELETFDIINIGYNIKKLCKSKPTVPPTFWQKCWSYITPTSTPPDPITDAVKRTNSLIIVGLNINGHKFLVATYHMPCRWYNIPLMNLHCACVLKNIHSKNIPIIFTGDFNSKPTSQVYEMITKGGDFNSSIPTSMDWFPPTFVSNEKPLKSVYYEHNRQEPMFTNHSRVKDGEEFFDTIDYIFTSSEFKTVSVLNLPETKPETISPNEFVPSDHFPLGVCLIFKPSTE
jgi:mRNA deadenylase 3'-5' endonuclease subunit Ccr4